ncbi:NifB/NifX family molybdenum-iron cluster-binding protein [uncultured Sunxiuqinia sp.]|jgi:predicted Fe-Mo cluster-binding NifX family protein|uniref:NifB/NifX family molybdenum-iron cluster-binding protein n=1 Tax=uncultured Sunxiuqinia sp. TaxID=1573825 RepID=UPI0030D8F399|tara:strand:+ start:37786 stop:38094 length:309 start_codon:yes stop_codon:yes gene_type:complete
MIAISATDKKLTAPMDLRFGRAPYFFVSDGEESRFIVNPYCHEEHDVAPRVVKLLTEAKVDKIITGEVGPKAHASLQKNKIQIIMLDEERVKISQVLRKIKF